MAELEGMLSERCRLVEGERVTPFCTHLEWYFTLGLRFVPETQWVRDAVVDVFLSEEGESGLSLRRVGVSCGLIVRSNYEGVASGLICESGFLDGFLVRELVNEDGEKNFLFGRRPSDSSRGSVFGFEKFLQSRGVQSCRTFPSVSMPEIELTYMMGIRVSR